MQKRFNVLFYDKNGGFIKTIKNKVLKSIPRIRSTINLGAGAVILDFNVAFDDFSSELNLDFLVRAEIWEFDKNNTDGQIVFSGFVSRIQPQLSQKGESVRATFLGFGAAFSRSMYRDGSGNPITETTTEPKTVLQNIISNFNAKYFNFIVWDSAEVETVGTNISYTFDGLKWKESVEKVRELSGGGYFWRVDPNRKFVFAQKPASATHKFHRSKHIDKLENGKTFEPILNSVCVYYGDLSLYEVAEDATSVLDYGEVFDSFNEPDIADLTTAAQLAAQKVDDGKDIKNAVILKINSTYNLESIKVGETCKILGSKDGADVFPENMTIVAVDYEPDFCTLTLEKLRDDLALAIQSLK